MQEDFGQFVVTVSHEDKGKCSGKLLMIAQALHVRQQ